MADRTTPYLGFNFIVALDPGSGGVGTPIGGFSDVSGLQTEITVAEYRAGNFPENHGEKLPSVYKTGDITLKRGLVNNTDIVTWVEQVRIIGVVAKKSSVVITLLDETH